MKSKNIYLVILILLFSSIILLAQDEPSPVFEPEEPFEVEAPDFEFYEFLKMSDKEESELLKNIKKDIQTELKVIKNANKEKYFELLRESQFKNIRFPFIAKRERVMHERERKIFEAEIKAEAYAVKYEKANDAERKKIKKDLRAELNELFEQKEERRKEEVEELENELKDLRKSLSVRQNNKKEIIERRLRELLDEDEYLDWD